MKKLSLVTALFIAALFLAGCLSTVHPLFTEKDLVVDTRLIGSWQKAKDNSKITYRHPNASEINALSPALQAQADKIYLLEERNEQGRIQSFNYAFMVKLGKYYYMDFYPATTAEQGSADNFFSAHYVPMHSIYRIQFKNNNSFSMQRLDGGYLEKLIRDKQIRIRHEVMEGGGFVITASTEELQQYLIKYSDVPEAYSNDNNDSYAKIN
jgi:hypothetical protein